MSTDVQRLPQPVHERDETSPAPGDLELVRGFLSLHDHQQGNPDSLPPSPASLRWWLETRGLLPEGTAVSDQELAWALRVRSALGSKVRENMGELRDADAIRLLDRAADETGLRPRFGAPGEAPIRVETTGVRGAIGKLLGIAFLAELDGSWKRFRICGDPSCSSVFYDRSRNHSGRWCSMSSCGNRAKVRAFRERRAAT